MADYPVPGIQTTIQPIPSRDWFLVSPPIVRPIFAEDLHHDSQAVTDGRYHPRHREIHGHMTPKLQDTFKTGTGGRTGRAFDVVTGTVQDDAKSEYSDKYYLLMNDGNPDAACKVVSHDSTPTIEAAEIHVHLGPPPPNSASAHATATNYAYLYLTEGATGPGNGAYRYRLAFVYGKTIALQFSVDGGVTYQSVMSTQDVSTVERHAKTTQRILVVTVLPDLDNGQLVIEFGNGNGFLSHAPDAITLKPGQTLRDILPNPCKVAFERKNGWCGLEYYPLRGQPAKASLTVDAGRVVSNPGTAKVLHNGTRPPNDNLQVQANVSTNDGQNFAVDVTATMPDAGDGEGSSEAARIAKLTLVTDADWQQHVPGGDVITESLDLPTIALEIDSVLDESNRCYHSTGTAYIDNYQFQYGLPTGRFAVDIWVDVGYAAGKVFCGIAGGGQGNEVSTPDPIHVWTMPLQGKEAVMMRASGKRSILDGWYLGGAARYGAEIGNVNPDLFCQTLPNLPYGETGSNPVADAPQLGRGTGLNPRYEFGPEVSPFTMNGTLAKESGDFNPIFLRPIPYYHGFQTNDDQYTFQTYFPIFIQPSVTYTDYDPFGLYAYEWIRFFSSVEDMRTEIDFQSIDARTRRLLYLHLEQTPDVMQRVGFRDTWFEQSPRWASADILMAVGQAAQFQSGINDLSCIFKSRFLPGIQAGDTIIVVNSYLGEFAMYITRCKSYVGMENVWGDTDTATSFSIIQARWVNNF